MQPASRDGLTQLQHALALLCAHGVRVNLERLYAHRNPVRLAMGVAAVPRRRPVKLKMDIPLVTLDEADRRELRERLSAALVGQARRPPSPAGATARGAAPGEGRDLVLQAHRQTMEQILAAHEQVMGEVLAATAMPANRAPPHSP